MPRIVPVDAAACRARFGHTVADVKGPQLKASSVPRAAQVQRYRGRSGCRRLGTVPMRQHSAGAPGERGAVPAHAGPTPTPQLR